MSRRESHRIRPFALLHRLFVHNGVQKLICLVLAFATWQVVRQNTSYEVLVSDVPLTVNAPEGMAVLDQTTSMVQIRFRGAREDIRFISRDQVSLNVDLRGRSDRLRQSVKLVPRYVSAPSRAQAVQFDPPEVTVMMDREVERMLPVKAVLEGTLPEGVRMEQAVCEPAAVRVRGAKQLVRDLEQVTTHPVSLDGRSSAFSTPVAVQSGEPLWSASPSRVTVHLTLVDETETRVFDEQPVRPLLAAREPRRVRIEPETVRLTVSGAPRRIRVLESRDLFVYVDCTELTESGTYDVAIRADVPAGVRVERVEPPAVRVVLERM